MMSDFSGQDEQSLSRRRFLQMAAAGASGLMLGSASQSSGAEDAKRGAANPPNIILITADEFRYDALGVAGNRIIRTPNLDRMASRGVRFTNTYCQGPLCQPSRASLITGRYVHEHGQTWNRIDMKPEWPTMMKQLQQAGYRTAKVGKTHFYARPPARTADLRDNADFIRRFGLDDIVEEHDMYVHLAKDVKTDYTEYLRERGLLETYLKEIPALGTEDSPIWEQYTGRTSGLDQEHVLTSFIAGRSVDWLKGYREKKPFFLWVSFVAPHPPIRDDAKWAEVYRDAQIPPGPSQRPQVPDNAYGTYLGGWLKGTRTDMVTPERMLGTSRHYYGMVSLIDQKIGEIVAAADRLGTDNTWFIFTADHGDMLGDHGLVFKNVFYRPSVLVPHIIRPPSWVDPKVIDQPTQHIDITATIVDLAQATPPEGMRGRSLIPMLQGTGRPREVVFSELAGHANQGNYFVMVANERYRYLHDTKNGIACELFDLKEDPQELSNLVTDAGYRKLGEDLHRDYIVPFLEGKVG